MLKQRERKILLKFSLQDVIVVEDKKSKNTNEANVDYEDHTSDYYDANGKIATLRKRRSSNLENSKKQGVIEKPDDGSSKRVKRSNHNKDLDPLGRSYYFSTYRKKGFSPDHWRSQLSK